jgi:putative colanic acid biosysnthesis UDP-glucose lipid carrier transferase
MVGFPLGLLCCCAVYNKNEVLISIETGIEVRCELWKKCRYPEIFRMQNNVGSDFLAIRRPFRYLIQLGIPAIVTPALALMLGWLDGVVSVAWPALIIITIAMAWMRFDLQQLAVNQRYRVSVFSTLFNRALALGIVTCLVFAIDGSIEERGMQIALFTISLWMCCAVLTVVLIELSILPVFRRKSEKIAIAAITESSIAFANGFSSQRFLAIEFLGFFEDRVHERLPNHVPFPVLCRIDKIADYLTEHEINHVLVSLPTQASYRFRFVLEQVLDSTSSVHYLHDFLLFRPIREAMTPIGRMSVFTIIDSPGDGIGSVIKRCFDLLGASLGLIALLPLFGIIALWIKLDSKGPVFFTQNRWGTDANPFQIYKFRSMTHATSMAASVGEVVIQTTQNDARVTRVGAFIRRTSLDELPQLLNIFKGDMSIVGPRPHAVGHNKQYRGLVKGYMLRHKVKPGLTGWAQIHGFRGETDTLAKMEMRVEHDLEYLRNWTPMLDIYIILKTVAMVASGKNAY